MMAPAFATAQSQPRDSASIAGPELVWDIVWELDGEEASPSGDGLSLSPVPLATWKSWLEGGVLLRPPERWAGVPVRHAIARATGKWNRAVQDGEPVPTGSASPFDPLAMQRSALLLQSRMVRKGYLEARVNMDTSRVAADKVALQIRLNPGRRLVGGDAVVRGEDSGLGAKEQARLSSQWSRWEGVPLDLDALEREREALSRQLQDEGWYGLISDYFTIRIDTAGSAASGVADVTLTVAPVVAGSDTVRHRLAKLDSLSFQWHPQSLEVMEDRTDFGTTWRIPRGRDIRGLHHRMQVDSGDTYSPTALGKARQSLRQLPLIEDVRVGLEIMAPPMDSSYTALHAHFDAYPSERRVMRVNGAVTSRQGLGGEMAFTLSDQDFRKRAEQVSLDLGLGLETVTPYGASDEGEGDPAFLNARVISAGVTYSANRLIPFGPDRFPKSNKPESLVSWSLRDESRPRFSRTYVQLSLVERFVENPATGSRVELRPIEAALTSGRLSPLFQAELDSLGSDVLTSSFQSRALIGSGVAWKLNPKRRSKQPWKWGMSLEFEGAGNLFHWIDPRAPGLTTVPLPSAFGSTTEVQVARYLRWTMEVKGGWSSDGKSGWFGRGYVGWAASSIDGIAVPLEKQFYVGGPNSMRGWQALGLGPGGTDNVGLRVRGDIRIELNLEYRKYLNDWVQLAAFVDAGNIWMTRPEPSRPNVEFNGSTFLPQVAYSAGFGGRLDFGYFLLRCDVARPVHWPQGEVAHDARWRIHPAVALPF